MPKPKVTNRERPWKPRREDRKWNPVPIDPQSGKLLPDGNPFDPEDPAGDWGAYVDEEGVFIVDYCSEESRARWSELFPDAPAVTERHMNTEGAECLPAGKREFDVDVEILERNMWFREYRCALVVETSMKWKITKREWLCDNSGLPVHPDAPGVWRQQGPEVTEEKSASRKSEFRCC